MFPLGIFVLWMVINKLTLGWFLWPFNLSFFGNNPPIDRVAFIEVWTYIYKEYLLWIVFAYIIFSSLRLVIRKKKMICKELIFFNLMFIFYSLFFYFNAFSPRYFLFLYPLVFISFSKLVEISFDLRILRSVIIIFLCLGFITTSFHNYFLSSSYLAYGADRDFLFMMGEISLYEQVVKDAKNNYSDLDLVITYFPLGNFFHSPFYGYVNERFQTYTCEEVYERLVKQKNETIFLILPIGDTLPHLCTELGSFQEQNMFSLPERRGAGTVDIYKIIQ
jgi:hypothetical protein